MSKPRPVLSQMPWNVKQLIVDSGDTETKIVLRPVSKEYKHLVSRSQISYKQLSFQLDADKRTAKITFVPHPGRKMQLKFFHKKTLYKVWNLEGRKTRNLKRDTNFLEAAINQFVKVLRNPKVLIEQFSVQFSGFVPGWEEFQNLKNEVLDSLQAFFVTLAHPIRVRYLFLHCDTQHDILKVLPFLQAGTLKSITLNKPRFDEIEYDLSEIAETEQWKLAEDLEVDRLHLCLPVEKWSHFTDTRVEIPDLSVSKVKSIFNSYINSTQWKSCSISSDYLDQQPLVDYFKELGTHEIDKEDDHGFTIHTPNSRKVTVRIMTDWVTFW